MGDAVDYDAAGTRRFAELDCFAGFELVVDWVGGDGCYGCGDGGGRD